MKQAFVTEVTVLNMYIDRGVSWVAIILVGLVVLWVGMQSGLACNAVCGGLRQRK